MSIEETLFSPSGFLGRDGFRWWIGQIAPRADQADQINDGEGWGQRYKVRIMGYHPFNTEDISNDELPFAICIIPTTAGSGGANYATSTMLQQGDVVFGFFLDGDQGQVPAILGHFARTNAVDDTLGFEEPFKPFSAFTEETPERERIVNEQHNEQNNTTQKTNLSSDKGKFADQRGAGQKVIPPDTCNSFGVSRMALALENLADRVEELSLTGSKLEVEIAAVGEQIETMANGFVGRMMDATYDWLEPQLQKGLDKVYDETFGKVFSQLGNSPQAYASAHAAGVASQVGEVTNIKNAENALSCVANKVVEGLKDTVSDMLKDLLASGLGIAGCVAANFAAKFLNNMVDGIEDAMRGPLSGLSNLLSPGLNIADFLRSSSFLIEDFSGFLDCNQTNDTKCPPSKKYEIAGGLMEKGADPHQYVIEKMQETKKGGLAGALDSLSEGLGDVTGGLDNVIGGIQNPSSLLTGGLGALGLDKLVPPGVSKTLGGAGRISGLIDDLSSGGSCLGGKRNCGNPKVEIFGGGGIGAIGQVVMGKFIDNTKGLTTLTDTVSRTASIIGVDLKVPGRNYKSPPAIRFADKCGIGHGAHGHAIIDPEKGTVTAIVVDTGGTGYPVITDPPTNVGLTTVFVENGGEGYAPGDQIDETVFVYPTGLPDVETGTPAPPAPGQVVPTDETLIPDPYTELVEPTQRIALQNVSGSPIFDVQVDPETGAINAVRVLNTLRFETPPVLKVISSQGHGAVLRPVFGELPPAAQQEPLTVIDCVGK